MVDSDDRRRGKGGMGVPPNHIWTHKINFLQNVFKVIACV